MKNILIYSILTTTVLLNNYSLSWPEAAGVKAVEKLDKVIKENMPNVERASTGLGRDFGEKFGTEALGMMGAGIIKAAETTGASVETITTVVKVTAVKTSAAVKAGAAYIAAAPATPYIVGGVACCAVGYGGYKVYRRYHPTLEQTVINEQHAAQAEEYRAKTAQSQVESAKHRKELEKLNSESAFRKCLVTNLPSSKDNAGVPYACSATAALYASFVRAKKTRDLATDVNAFACNQ